MMVDLLQVLLEMKQVTRVRTRKRRHRSSRQYKNEIQQQAGDVIDWMVLSNNENIRRTSFFDLYVCNVFVSILDIFILIGMVTNKHRSLAARLASPSISKNPIGFPKWKSKSNEIPKKNTYWIWIFLFLCHKNRTIYAHTTSNRTNQSHFNIKSLQYQY